MTRLHPSLVQRALKLLDTFDTVGTVFPQAPEYRSALMQPVPYQQTYYPPPTMGYYYSNPQRNGVSGELRRFDCSLIG